MTPDAPPARSTVADAAPRIAAFWTWWGGARERLKAGADSESGLPKALQEELSAQVEALHPELAWEVGMADDGVVDLSVSPEGDFTLRRLTEAWKRAAPAGITDWRFYPARNATPDRPTLHYARHEVALSRLRFGLERDTARSVVHVKVWHPAFTSMADEERETVTLLALDALLGEDVVESHVGRVELASAGAPELVPAASLLAAIEEARTAPPDTWAMLEGRNKQGQPLLASLQLRRKRLDHLQHEDHLKVTLRYRDVQESGFPTKAEHAAGRDLEKALTEALGSTALAYGHVVHAGELRVLFYVKDRAAAEARLAAWRPKTEGWKVDVDWRHDPEWEELRKW